MYNVTLQYFNEGGFLLGEGRVISPGCDPIALKGYVRKQPLPKFCGMAPTYVYILPEGASPVILDMRRYS